MRKSKCDFRPYDMKCYEESMSILKVRIFHPETGRKSKRVAELCIIHYQKAIKEKMKGWTTSKSKKPIIGYEVIEPNDEIDI